MMKDQPVNRGGLYARYFLKPSKPIVSTQRTDAVRRVTKTVTEMERALPKVGRPRKTDKLSAADKQRAYRERKKHGQTDR